jgi:hypothetical protein
MEETKKDNQSEVDVQALVQRAISEYVRQDSSRREPALKAELQEERRKREALEKRLNQMAEENRKSREVAELAERSSKIKSELQALGVTKVDLAYKAVEDDIQRAEDGRLVVRGETGEVGVREYLSNFVNDNPEFLPARIQGGSGIVTNTRTSNSQAPVSINSISPSMSKEDKERVRQEILRVTSQNLTGV